MFGTSLASIHYIRQDHEAFKTCHDYLPYVVEEENEHSCWIGMNNNDHWIDGSSVTYSNFWNDFELYGPNCSYVNTSITSVYIEETNWNLRHHVWYTGNCITLKFPFLCNSVAKEPEYINYTSTLYHDEYPGYIQVQIEALHDIGLGPENATFVFASDNVIYDDLNNANEINDKFMILLDSNETVSSREYSNNIDNVLYNDVVFNFKWKRSNLLTMVGNISRFRFQPYYSEFGDHDRSENRYIEDKIGINKQSKYFDLCNYPVPSRFDFNIYSQWVESGINTAFTQKIQGETCADSDATFWDDTYVEMCDNPTGYLQALENQYVKIFECNSDNSGNDDSIYNYFYTGDQLDLYTTYAKYVKIEVIDYHDAYYDPERDSIVPNSTIYSVTSIKDAYPVSNLKRNRALSHPYDFNSTWRFDDYAMIANISATWNGDEALLEAMATLEDYADIYAANFEYNLSEIAYQFDQEIVFNNPYGDFSIVNGKFICFCLFVFISFRVFVVS